MTALNFILISPHFPENFETFALRLKENGVCTLGIADIPYEELSENLKQSLTEYYRVDQLEDYDQVYRAVAFFAHKYGKIDRIESHNEHWLTLDAKLRTDFNVFGYKEKDLYSIKSKSGMKEVFRSLQLPVAEGFVFSTPEEAFAIAKSLQFPVIVKPNEGVGASNTYRLQSLKDLEYFLKQKSPHNEFIMEEFIDGDIVTFDGLTDKNATIIHSSTLIYSSSVLEMIEKNQDMFFYVSREIPEDLRDMGTKIVNAYRPPERFFHLEFFRKKSNGALIPLEVNMRPAGGASIDMFNYANNLDIFNEYARLVTSQSTKQAQKPLYYCAYVSRKDQNNYRYRREDLISTLGNSLIDIQQIPGIFSQIMGNEGYLIREKSKENLFSTINYIQEKE